MEDFKEELREVEEELASVEAEIQDLLERQNGLLDRKSELKAIITQHNDDAVKQRINKTWDGTDFPWTFELDRQLEAVFHLRSLRPMQRQTMNATMSGEDCLLIMPTGGGKSLCFQLPAVVDKGVTLVISPLVSLMEDQQMALQQLGVASAMLNSSSDKDSVKSIQNEMVNPAGTLRLLYVTPEKLAKNKGFMNKLEKCYVAGRLARLVIDEVHCCSQWGHDFRPDYKFLGILRRQFPNTPILGLTATATTKVLEDVKKILNIPRALLFKASFNRPNLFYQVMAKPSSSKEVMNKMYSLITTQFPGMSGIVYCFSRKDTVDVTKELQSRGLKAGCYHADIEAQSRSRIHRRWLAGQIQVVVATVAFGMGIDKPNVRFVIHHSISKSMENLYQESGRAGRDDKRSDCIVFYRLADVMRQSSMVFTEQTGLVNLHGIVKYCTDISRCRRSIIARHFGEVWDSSQCNGMCDHCQSEGQGATSESRDVTRHCLDVLTLLDAAAAIEQRVTISKLVDAWYGRGPTCLKVKSVAAPVLGVDKVERILAHMLVQGYISEDFHFTAYSTICYIVSGPKAKLLQNKTAKVFMYFSSKLGQSTNKNKSSLSASSSSSSSSSSSRTAAATSTSLSSPKTAALDKHGEKPKLVVVNKENSHFHATTSSASPPKSSSFATVGVGVLPSLSSSTPLAAPNASPTRLLCSSPKHSKETPGKSGKRVRTVNNVGSHRVMESDRKINLESSDEDEITIESPGVQDSIKTSTNKALSREKSNGKSLNTRKRKINTIIDDSDDDDDIVASADGSGGGGDNVAVGASKNQHKLLKELRRVESNWMAESMSPRVNGMRKKASIVISDDSEDDFTD